MKLEKESAATLIKQIKELKSEKSILESEVHSLKESTKKFKELFYQSPLPYQSLDENGKLIEINPKWLELFHYKKEEVINHSFAEFIAPDYLEKLSEDFPRFKKTGVIENLEQAIISKDGKKIDILVDGNTCYDTEGNFLYTHCILRDVTDKKMILDELHKTILEKDKFFSIIAHDLRNPIVGFTGLTKLLAQEFSVMTLTDIHELIATINESAYSLNELLENLLEWSRLQRGHISINPINFNLNDLLESSMNTLKTNLDNKQITIINEVDNNINIFADVNMISSVINNLLTNAMKFSHNKSKIIISSKIIKDFVEISIIDFGTGIEKQNIEKLFKLDEKFISTGTANEKGTGLGLILCKEFLEKNLGTIKVKSKVNVGSEFIISLPLSK